MTIHHQKRIVNTDKVEGSVPLLKSVAQPYDGNVMIPFSNDFTLVGTPPATESVAEVASAATSVSEVVATVVDTAVSVADKASDFVPSLLN